MPNTILKILNDTIFTINLKKITENLALLQSTLCSFNVFIFCWNSLWKFLKGISKTTAFLVLLHSSMIIVVRTLTQCHTDLAYNASYHFAASGTVSPRVPPYLARDRLHLLAHIYDSVASIHMTKNPG